MGKESRKIIGGHLAALLTAAVWGSTFLASKVALDAGLSPIILMFVRFSVATLFYLCISRAEGPQEGGRPSLRTELLFLLLGLTGGSAYFLFEYCALLYTSAVNVGVITSTVPIVTTAALIFLGRARVWWQYVVGSVLAFGGVLLIVFDGRFTLDVHPLGDLLAFGDVLMWSAYTILLEHLGKSYSPAYVSRRLFAYALLTLAPALFFIDLSGQAALLCHAEVFWPVAYLALVASVCCMYLWNVAVNRLGAVKTNMYLYLLTVVPVAASALLAPSEVSQWKVIGSVLVLIGVVLADHTKPQ